MHWNPSLDGVLVLGGVLGFVLYRFELHLVWRSVIAVCVLALVASDLPNLGLLDNRALSWHVFVLSVSRHVLQVEVAIVLILLSVLFEWAVVCLLELVFSIFIFLVLGWLFLVLLNWGGGSLLLS